MDKDYISWAKDFFKEDTYAMDTTGIVIEDVNLNYAKCSLKLEKKHKNANNTVMGGAVYTLIDVTFAIAANSKNCPTVTLNSSVDYLSSVPCEGRITAEAKCVKAGNTICVFDVDVYHESGKHIATARLSGYVAMSKKS